MRYHSPALALAAALALAGCVVADLPSQPGASPAAGAPATGSPAAGAPVATGDDEDQGFADLPDEPEAVAGEEQEGAAKKPANKMVDVAGAPGDWADAAVDGQGPAARFRPPSGLAWNPKAGTIVVLDSGATPDQARIRRVTSKGVVTSIPLTELVPLAKGETVADLAEIAADADGDYWFTQRHRVLVTGDDGESEVVVGVTDEREYGTHLFDSMSGMAIGPDGKAYLAIRHEPYEGEDLCPDDLGDQVYCSGDEGPVEPDDGEPTDEYGLQSNYDDETSHAIIRVDSATGKAETIAGGGDLGYLDGPGDAAQFGEDTNDPSGGGEGLAGIVVASTGDVFVADPFNHCIRRIAAGQAGFPVTTFAGNPQADPQGPSWKSGTGKAAVILTPTHLAVDGKNNLYVINEGVLDPSSRSPKGGWTLQRVTPTGKVRMIYEGKGAGTVDGLAVSPKGVVYLALDGAIRKVVANR